MARVVAVLVAALLAALAVGWLAYELQAERTSHAETRLEHSREREKWERQKNEEFDTALAEERERVQRLTEIADESHKQVLDLADALRRSDDERSRLLAALEERERREQAAAGARRVAPAHDGGANDGGAQAAGVPADMYARLDAAARRVGEYADRVAIAGFTCEQQYDSLNGAAE